VRAHGDGTMRNLLMALALCVVWSGEAAWAGSRLHALVVGVDHYADVTVNGKAVELTNPGKDAQAVKQGLEKEQGFEVVLLADPEDDTRKGVIETKWAQILDKAKDNDVVLFYFAGHGVELKGNNYLLPRDASYRSDSPDEQERVETLARTSVEVQSLIQALAEKQEANQNLIGIFIIDACRENPFDFSSTAVRKLVVELGPRVAPTQQIFVMYSAGAGQEAADNPDSGHSLYADTLLGLLKSKDMTLTEMAQQLRLHVYDASGRAQLPAYYDQLATSRTLSGEPGQPRTTAPENDAFGAPSRSLGHREAFTECPFCPELVVLRSGDFEMGSDKMEAGHMANEEPRHPVKIGKKFAIGKYEVTNQEWDQFLAERGCVSACRPPHGQRGARKPVVDVSWSDANEYAGWLSRKTNATYRLPTEAEWEYAARADAKKENGAAPRYFFGDRAERLCEYSNGADLSVGVLPYANRHCDDGVGRETSLAGRYKPNDWGLYDMLGNAWEWVQDCWHDSYDKAPADGAAWTDAGCSRRVVRGGSWRSGADALRSAARNAFPSDRRRSTVGFRVVREIAD
jgi:formylglycine-generating enzyme required for sulfatase activity